MEEEEAEGVVEEVEEVVDVEMVEEGQVAEVDLEEGLGVELEEEEEEEGVRRWR